MDEVSQEKIQSDFSSYLEEKVELTVRDKLNNYCRSEDFADSSWQLDLLNGLKVPPIDYKKERLPVLADIAEEGAKLSSELANLQQSDDKGSSSISETKLTEQFTPLVDEVDRTAMKLKHLFRELGTIVNENDLMPKQNEVQLDLDYVREIRTFSDLSENFASFRKDFTFLNSL
ncbi:hypothetical protein HDE_01933 [Halotydeus destructor]|nr:hypothetical protein HDE_01933 [Halotydeus destructor]